MKHRSTTSIISSIMLASLAVPSVAKPSIREIGPSEETICSLQLFARAYKAEPIKADW